MASKGQKFIRFTDEEGTKIVHNERKSKHIFLCLLLSYNFNQSDEFLFFIQCFPSTILETSILLAESPTTFNIVAGGSIIVAIIVKIGNADTGKPSMVIINISDIVPPPIGTAVTSNVARRATPNIFNEETSLLNKQTKNIILNTLPIIDPSLWKLVPSGIVVSAMSSWTPIFLAHIVLTGIDAADEQVPNDVNVAGNIFFQ